MADWLRNFDRLSFWLGFLAASLFWFLVGRLRPAFDRWRIHRLETRLDQRREREVSDEIRLGNDTLRVIQRLHLGAPLFSLDEILIPPRLLAPPVPPQLYEPPPSQDITDFAIPYTPDWPEMLSFYNAPTLSPVEALSGGANLAITGQPGSGKTVALAYLALQLIRKDPEAGPASGLTPVWLHAGDLLGAPAGKDPVETLLAVLAPQTASISAKRLPGFIQSLLTGERLLLLLDGLDELSPAQFEIAVEWLASLLEVHPKLRSVVTAHSDLLGRLPALGFHPIPLAAWGPPQRLLLIGRWSDLWNRHIAGKTTGASAADPLMVIGWLLNTTARLTPLELTLKIWAAMAGDAMGPGPLAGIEAYLRRMLAGSPAKNRSGLEQMAAQAVLTGQPVADRRLAESWLGGSDGPPTAHSGPSGTEGDAADAERVRAGGALPDLLQSGLLVSRLGDRVSLQHPVLLGYLAAQRLVALRAGGQLAGAPEWAGRSTTLGFLAVLDGGAEWLTSFLDEPNEDILNLRLLEAGRWLRLAPENLPWVSPLLGNLASGLQQTNAPLALKTRLLIILVLSGNSGAPVLLRRLSAAPAAHLRQLAAAGMGMVHDSKAGPELLRLLKEGIPEIYQAAILALVALNEKTGLEAVAGLLLSGNASQSRSAAEGLANHAEEGHPTLEEAAGVEDPGVRRAAVFGLGRIRQPWAIQMLEKLRAEDPQWTVQDAANQILQPLETGNARLPRPLPALTDLPWLLAFAAERGMGIAPGQPAQEMLARVLREGSEDQILAAVYYLSYRGNESGILPLYHIYFGQRGDLREQAFEALRRFKAMGISLPPPSQYNLR